MIKSLRNKLLLINILIISALILGSFTAIYISSSRSSHRDTDELFRSAERFYDEGRRPQNKPDQKPPSKPSRTPDPDESTKENNENNSSEHASQRQQPGGNHPDFMPVFTAFLNDDGSIAEVSSAVEIDGDFALSAVSAARSSGEDYGGIRLNSTYWQFKIFPDHILFMEITSRVKTLQSLMVTLIVVGICALIVIFFISLYFANRAIRPVEEAWDKQNRFIADASHELKTPLTTINTNIDVLLSHEQSTILDEKKWLLYIKSEAERMAALTNDLLCLARMDAGADKSAFSPVNFSEAAERAMLTMEAVFFEKRIDTDYDIDDDIIIQADSGQITQLIMILLDNAVKYTPEGGRIFMRLKKNDKYAALSVENTGEGISAEDIGHIFDRFYRTDKSRARESGGQGLGLSIADAICKRHGGRIFAESAPGEYTRFTAELSL